MTHRRIAPTVFLVLAGFIAPLALRAQTSPLPDPGQQAAIVANGKTQLEPASFVLRHSSELALSAAQVTSLKALVVVERDSSVARQAHLLARIRGALPSPAILAIASWTGEATEAALREELCRQSANQADFMIGMMNDRRAVVALLTPAQIIQLPQIQNAEMMKLFKQRQ